MDAVNQVPVAIVQFMEGLVPQDPGIVDHHVDPAKGVECVLNDFLAVGHRVMVGDGGTASLANLGYYAVSRAGVGPLALRRAAKIVDQHVGPLPGEQQRMGPSQAAARPRHDHDFIFEAHRLIHYPTPAGPRTVSPSVSHTACTHNQVGWS
ncbi:hypothetical protein D3C84_551140 [compost metagenome]